MSGGGGAEPLPLERFDVEAGGGLRLHVTRAGSGPPLILLHGFTGSDETWSPIRALLGNRWTTLAVNLPGHGRSTAPEHPERYALGAFADDLALVLDVAGIARAAVLGYSLGGRAALRFALVHPARVAAIVLESTSPGIVDQSERAARVTSDHALADSIERDGVAAFVEHWQRLPLWASQASLAPEIRSRLKGQRLKSDPRGLANSLRGAGVGADPAHMEWLSGQLAPALMVAGSLDDKYVAQAQLLQAAMPQASLTIVAGAGHAVHLERPAAFADAVAHFLEAVAREKGRWQ